MIRRSGIIAVVAAVLSLLLHALGVFMTPPIGTQPRNTRASEDVIALGNSFEDVAEDVAAPVEAEPVEPEPVEEADVEPPVEAESSEALIASANPRDTVSPGEGAVEPVEAETAGPVQPEAITEAEPEAAVEPEAEAAVAPEAEAAVAPEPEAAVAPEPEAAVEAAPEVVPPVGPVEAAPATEVAQDAPVEAQPAEPATVAPAEGGSSATADVAPPSAVPVLPIGPSPVTPSAVLPVVVGPSDIVDPQTPDLETTTVEPDAETGGTELAVTESPRPRPAERPVGAEGEVVPEVGNDLIVTGLGPVERMESPISAYQRDRNDLSVREPGGRQSGGFNYSGSSGSGNSNKTNYAGRVLVHLNRAKTVPVSGQGTARVFFELRADGSVAWVDVVSNTGSDQVAWAAKEQVRRAAPFPPPPEGAPRRMSFVYRVR